MQTFWSISYACTLCGKKMPTEPEEQPSREPMPPMGRAWFRTELIGAFELTYVLCPECASSRQDRCGLDLLPIDGTQPCFYCSRSAQHVRDNQDVYLAIRQCRLHYTCRSCHELERAKLKHCFLRLIDTYPRLPVFPKQLIADMDAEIRAAYQRDRKE